MPLRVGQTVAEPAVVAAQQVGGFGIFGHEVDFQFAQAQAANDFVLRRLLEAFLFELSHQRLPLGITGQVHHQIDVVGIAHFFQGELVGQQQGCGAAADKGNLLAKLFAERLGDDFEHLNVLCAAHG
ncbi:hypothetical protein D3C81_1308810 [compost metagenome]